MTDTELGSTNIDLSAATTKTMKISSIKRDGGTQAREGTKTNAVEEYSAAIRNGEVFPPVVVFDDGDNLFLADGFHRIEASINAGLEDIEAKVFEGTIHDARWYALGANKEHGERLTNADKRHGVIMVLKDEKLSELSGRQIAAQCKVSHTFVENMRKEILETGNGCQSDPVAPVNAEKNKNKKDKEDIKEKGKKDVEHDAELERLKQEIAEREEREKTQGEKHRAELDELRNSLAEAMANPSNNDDEAEQLRYELEEKEAVMRDLRGQLEAAKSAQQESSSDIPSADVEAIVAERLNKLQESHLAELDELRNSLTEAMANPSSNDDETEQLRREIEELRKQLDSAAVSPAVSDSANLDNDIENLRELNEKQAVLIKRLIYDNFNCKKARYSCSICSRLETCIGRLSIKNTFDDNIDSGNSGESL